MFLISCYLVQYCTLYDHTISFKRRLKALKISVNSILKEISQVISNVRKMFELIFSSAFIWHNMADRANKYHAS